MQALLEENHVLLQCLTSLLATAELECAASTPAKTVPAAQILAELGEEIPTAAGSPQRSDGLGGCVAPFEGSVTPERANHDDTAILKTYSVREPASRCRSRQKNLRRPDTMTTTPIKHSEPARSWTLEPNSARPEASAIYETIKTPVRERCVA